MPARTRQLAFDSRQWCPASATPSPMSKTMVSITPWVQGTSTETPKNRRQRNGTEIDQKFNRGGLQRKVYSCITLENKFAAPLVYTESFERCEQCAIERSKEANMPEFSECVMRTKAVTCMAIRLYCVQSWEQNPCSDCMVLAVVISSSSSSSTPSATIPAHTQRSNLMTHTKYADHAKRKCIPSHPNAAQV